MKYLKNYNESIKNSLKPKSDDKIEEELFKKSHDEILNKSIRFNYLKGFKYLIDNNLVDETTKYILEKYKFGLHPDEKRDYEYWFLQELKSSYSYKSGIYIFYKKPNDKNNTFMYDEENYIFYNDYDKIYRTFLVKFKLNFDQIYILIKGMVEKNLKIRVDKIDNDMYI